MWTYTFLVKCFCLQFENKGIHRERKLLYLHIGLIISVSHRFSYISKVKFWCLDVGYDTVIDSCRIRYYKYLLHVCLFFCLSASFPHLNMLLIDYDNPSLSANRQTLMILIPFNFVLTRIWHVMTLTHKCLVSYTWGLGKQWSPVSDAAGSGMILGLLWVLSWV